MEHPLQHILGALSALCGQEKHRSKAGGENLPHDQFVSKISTAKAGKYLCIVITIISLEVIKQWLHKQKHCEKVIVVKHGGSELDADNAVRRQPYQRYI